MRVSASVAATMDYLREVDAHQLRAMAHRAALEDARQTCVAARLTRHRSSQLRTQAHALCERTEELRAVARTTIGRTSAT
jgi:hypothetical protein